MVFSMSNNKILENFNWTDSQYNNQVTYFRSFKIIKINLMMSEYDYLNGFLMCKSPLAMATTIVFPFVSAHVISVN